MGPVVGVRAAHATTERWWRATWVLAVCASLVAGCSTGDEPRLTVLAASSLAEVVAAQGEVWGEVPIDVVDAGSQVLAAQVRAGAPADVVLLADPALAAALTQEGAAAEPVVVAGNSLVLVTPPDGTVDDVTDLRDPSLRVVLADTEVPLGRATRGALGGDATEVLAGADSLEDAARSVLAKVVNGDADAAIVYATDARSAGDAVRLVPWPAGAATATVVTVQELTERGAAFAAHLRSPAAAATFVDHGFTVD